MPENFSICGGSTNKYSTLKYCKRKSSRGGQFKSKSELEVLKVFPGRSALDIQPQVPRHFRIQDHPSRSQRVVDYFLGGQELSRRHDEAPHSSTEAAESPCISLTDLQAPIRARQRALQSRTTSPGNFSDLQSIADSMQLRMEGRRI